MSVLQEITHVMAMLHAWIQKEVMNVSATLASLEMGSTVLVSLI